jgi:hypothetical protein
MIIRSIFYLTNNDELVSPIKIGEKLIISFKPGEVPSREITVRDPSGLEEKINLESSFHGYQYNYENTNVPGFYEFCNDTKILKTIPVNVDPEESDLTKISNSELIDFLKLYSLSDRYKEISDDSNLAQILEQSRYGIELWKHLILLVLLLAVLEMIIAKDAKKQIADLKA